MEILPANGARDEPPPDDPAGVSASPWLANYVRQRDQQSFAELVRLYGPLVYGVCRRVVGSHHDAEDAFQATFLVLSRKAGSIRNGAVLPGWLYRVAYHVSLRAKRARVTRLTKEQPMGSAQEPAAADRSVWSDLEPLLDLELSRLSEKYRIPVLLCDLGGRTQKEAALELGWSPGTVSTRLIKARSILAARLARHGFALSAGGLAVLLSQNAAAAGVPASLVASTLQTAAALSTAQALSAGAASFKAATLAHATMKSMLGVHLKFAAAALVVLAAAAVQLQTREAPPEPAANDNPPVVIERLEEVPAEALRALEENAAQLNPISISYIQQLHSLLPENEILARLKIPKNSYQFQPRSYRRIWQDGKYYYMFRGITLGTFERDGGEPVVHREERSFDGKALYHGELREGREGTLWKGRDSFIARVGRYHRDANFVQGEPYFSVMDGCTGLYFHEPQERDVGMQARSLLLYFLKEGSHRLISVARVALDDRPHLRLEFRGDNMWKTYADQQDIEKLKRDEAFLNSSPEAQKSRIENILAWRKLPATKRLVYFLDPELHYAVRQSEEWYDPQTLVLRCRRSDFEQLPGRQLWLPRRCEVDEPRSTMGAQSCFRNRRCPGCSS
jgi:RNA polymerase sigma factor (sigma-70 family)